MQERRGGETQSSGEEIIEGRMETEDGAETPGWRKGASLENRRGSELTLKKLREQFCRRGGRSGSFVTLPGL